MAGPNEATLSQYKTLTEEAGIVRLPHRSIIEISGADRVGFVHNFCTNDIKKLSEGRGCEAFFTSHQGKTVGHGLVFAEPDALIVETTPGQSKPLIEHLDRFVISERVAFHDRTAEWAEIFVGGPAAARILEKVGNSPLPAELLAHLPLQLGSVRTVVRRAPFTRFPGWFIQADARNVDELISELTSGGIPEVAEEVLEVCRLEACWPWFGIDIKAENLPQEIDRNEEAISFKKGCYLGQETVARLDALGHVNRLLALFKVDTPTPPPAGATVVSGDREVGAVTSSAWSPKHQASLAFALVRRTAAVAGTSVGIAGAPGLALAKS